MKVQHRTSELRELSQAVPNPHFRRGYTSGEIAVKTADAGARFAYHTFTWDDGSVERGATLFRKPGNLNPRHVEQIDRRDFIEAMLAASRPVEASSFSERAVVLSYGQHAPESSDRLLNILWGKPEMRKLIEDAYREMEAGPVQVLA